MNGSGSITAYTAYLAGDLNIGNNATLTLTEPATTYMNSGVEDPFEGKYPEPVTQGGCTKSNYKVSGGNATLWPGRYCGGIQSTTSGTLDFMPGTYYIDGGDLRISASGVTTCSACSGDLGVTFVLTASNASQIGAVTINGGGTVMLGAPGKNSGEPYAGLLIYVDRRASNTGGGSSISGSSNLVFSGAIYSPTRGLSFGGTGDGVAGRRCLVVVAHTVSLAGDSTLSTPDCELMGTNTPKSYDKVVLLRE
jgi:hypothetical protein